MKVLWLCNFMLPAVAEHLRQTATNKEGWISGMAEVILRRRESNDIQLGIAFPVPENMDGYREELNVYGGKLTCYGFYEDTAHPENYDPELEDRMRKITEDFKPDVIHCYGTEYPHTLAMCKAYPSKEKILISIQGLCSVYANTYFANLPQKVIRNKTFRDWLKKDSLVEQKEKYDRRGKYEMEAVKIAGNVAGRTAWDHFYTNLWNKNVKYYHLNETLRSCFYEGEWTETSADPHTIFLSQGNYPIKGLHYMLAALPRIREKYPDVKVNVAGDSVIKFETWKDKIKISAYGRYLRQLIKRYGLEENVSFLGSLTAIQMKQQYLNCALFVCPSTIENSPNSLGEAMILGAPCVSAEVGGVSSIFTDKKDGILYAGFRTKDNEYDLPYLKGAKEQSFEEIADALADAVITMWEDPATSREYCKNAMKHARDTHDREKNYGRMIEIYESIKNA